MARVSTRHPQRKRYVLQVVDSDDWLDAEALQKVMQTLRGFAAMEQPVDLLMCNYVYEHVVDNTHHTVSYKSILPQDRVFGLG